MTKTCELPILSILYHIICKYEKLYCYPSQIKIQELLEEHQGIKRCNRTINRWLRWMEDSGLIKRKRRIKRDRVKGTIFLSTMYIIKIKGYKLLYKFSVDCWEKIEEITKKIVTKKHHKEIQEPQPASQEKQISTEDMRRVWDRAKLAILNITSFFV